MAGGAHVLWHEIKGSGIPIPDVEVLTEGNSSRCRQSRTSAYTPRGSRGSREDDTPRRFSADEMLQLELE